MERYGIVVRSQCGKLMISPVKQELIEQEIAYHLGVVKLAFDAKELEEDLVENIDETHFVLNMDNGKTLGFIAENEVKHVDVSSGGDGMTMVFRVTGGRCHDPTSIYDIPKSKTQLPNQRCR